MKERNAWIVIFLMLSIFAVVNVSAAQDTSNLRTRLLSDEILMRNDGASMPKGTTDVEISVSYQEKDYTDLFGTDRLRTISMPLTVRYGLTDKMAVWLTVPLVLNSREIPDDEKSTKSENSTGIGDLLLGMRYQLLAENSNWPGITLSTLVKANNGKVTDESENSYEPSIGSGNWQVCANVNVTRTFEPITTFFQVGYDYNFVSGNYKAGDAVNFNAGFVFSIITDLSLKVETKFAYTFREQRDGAETGALGTPASVVLGLGKSFGQHLFIEPSVSIGLTKDAPDYNVSISVLWRF